MNPFSLLTDIFELFKSQPSDSAEPKAGQSRHEFLREEVRRLRRRRERLARLKRLYLLFGTLAVIGSVIGYYITKRPESWVAAAYGALFLLFPIAQSPRAYDTDILSLESELDLLETTEVTPEQRAEKLFKHHQYELQKYYDQTLRHSKWIFIVGVACIFVGFATIGITFWLVVRPQASTEFQEKILVSALGVVGGILANFIAVIYLRMFSEILKSVTDFHNRLVATHNLYFANFMVTKVTEPETRDDIVTEIAKNLTKV